MRQDALLLEAAHTFTQPILHLYEWEGASATYGYFNRPEQFINMQAARCKGLQLARRPTGGGIIFHLWDMAFSVLMPSHRAEFSQNTLENYAFVNQAVLHAVQAFFGQRRPLCLIQEDALALEACCAHFCMARPTKYDVLLEGKKVAGAAQRKTKAGFLHQGSIALTLPAPDYLSDLFSSDSAVQKAMLLYTYPLLGSEASLKEVLMAKKRLKELLTTHLNEASLKYYR